MALTYGFLRCRVASTPQLKGSRHGQETQYHLHATLAYDSGGGETQWDCAINVGTDDADDLLQYRLIYDFHHPVMAQLLAAPPGFSDLTGTADLPALDFLRTDVLSETGSWRPSDVMDGSESPEPLASLKRLLVAAQQSAAAVFVFGRKYTDGDGIHDVHMNQGSQGSGFFNFGDDRNDHNDVWQDGAVIVQVDGQRVAGYFTAFTQQIVPTDGLGNPQPNAHEITDADVGSMTLQASPT